MNIRYCERAERTTLLGPGERAVLWVYGCCFDCPGCIAQNYRFGEYDTAETQALAEWFLQTGADGLTISGGEPFLQAAALAELVAVIRQARDIGVIIYTGFEYEALLEKEDAGVQALLTGADLLIDGPYRQEEDHNEPYRGSANQRILFLTERYRDVADAYYFGTKGRKVEITANGKRTVMIGVPSREQALLWEHLKESGYPPPSDRC